ncbi:30S ribosomal protein S6--L-glutamate ligase [bacterium]|nr:30S ribosomal protein S6--L-glutamate ligase [bacterium]
MSRIAILSQDPTLFSTRRLREAAEEQGHDVKLMNYMRCTIHVRANAPQISYQGDVVENYDAVIARIGTGNTAYGTAVVRQFELMGTRACNSASAILNARDKLRSLQLLAGAGIGMPATGYAHSTQDQAALITAVGGAPLVIKLLEGTQGIGVVLADTASAAKSVMEAFRSLDADILVQEFVKESAGQDLRCFVVGGKVVAAMLRKASGGDFRANIHRGATAEVATLSDLETQTALRAAEALGLEIAGVDMLRSSRGPLVIEVNASPGLEGIEKATGVDVAGAIIKSVTAPPSPAPGSQVAPAQ